MGKAPNSLLSARTETTEGLVSRFLSLYSLFSSLHILLPLLDIIVSTGHFVCGFLAFLGLGMRIGVVGIAVATVGIVQYHTLWAERTASLSRDEG